MGTVFVDSTALQLIGIKTIIGGFITIGLILLINCIFKKSTKDSLPIFLLLCGVIKISTLILLTLAINTIALTRGWQ